MEARARAMENPPAHPMAYGDIETVSIDGRTGWAWMEVWRENGLHEVRYHVAVPYDTITYTVDFTTGDPKFKIRPDLGQDPRGECRRRRQDDPLQSPAGLPEVDGTE